MSGGQVHEAADLGNSYGGAADDDDAPVFAHDAANTRRVTTAGGYDHVEMSFVASAAGKKVPFIENLDSCSVQVMKSPHLLRRITKFYFILPISCVFSC